MTSYNNKMAKSDVTDMYRKNSVLLLSSNQPDSAHHSFLSFFVFTQFNIFNINHQRRLNFPPRSPSLGPIQNNQTTAVLTTLNNKTQYKCK